MVSVSQLLLKMDAYNSNDLIDCHRVFIRNSCIEISCMTTVEKTQALYARILRR